MDIMYGVKKAVNTVKKAFDNGKDINTYNTDEENKFLSTIITDQENAESARQNDPGHYGGLGIEDIWEDEFKMFVGDQWNTNFSYRSKKVRQTRPNSVDNFIFQALTNQHASIIGTTPEVSIEPEGDDDKETAEKLTCLCKFNDKRNKFPMLWKKGVLQFLCYGPIIGAVLWDDTWMGGKGPDRWTGDVRIFMINRRNIYFDPAIIDLDERLQECGFTHLRLRKKLKYFKNTWPEKGQYVSIDNNENDMQDEGNDPQQAYLIMSFRRGMPEFMPEKRKQELLEKAARAEAEGDEYKAIEYREMAAGNVEGIHVAYTTTDVFLEYTPYIYEDGLYPFVYKTLYYDENSPNGFGEIRNIKVPQVMHNKADEIEIEAMAREGLGGGYYDKGAITPQQIEIIKKNAGKGGYWAEVTSINRMKEREGVRVPSSLIQYKEQKQRMVETISQNTPIQQGMSPGANIPFRTVNELGARSDVKTKGKIEVLEDFLTELNQLRINRFAEFYTEDRYYRIKGDDGKPVSGTFNRAEMYKEWNRKEIVNELGEVTGYKQERYIPEFDVSVKINSERPTDRNYYTTTAFEMFGKQAMGINALWYTLEEGKFPTKEDVLQELTENNMGMQIAETLSQMPPELQQAFFNAQQQMLQNLAMSQNMMQQQQGQTAR